MRILVVQESDWLERGPHQQHHLMERLQKRGNQVRVIDYEIDWARKVGHSLLSGRSEFLAAGKTYKDTQIQVIRPGIVKMPFLDYVSIPFSHGAEIYRQIKDFRPNVIIGMGILNTYVAMRLSTKCGVPFAYYLIDALHTLIPQREFTLLGKILERRILRSSNVVFVINKQLREYAVGMGADPRKVALLGAGIDTERFNPGVDGEKIRKQFHIGEDEIVLFFMGWLYNFSGIKEVANSMLSHKNKPTIRLLVLGRGDLFEDLRNLQKNELKDRLILVGWQPYEEVPEYVSASDICLLPAYNNNVMRNIVPIKIYEYMACGKPVITTKLPGIMREFGEGNGIVYVNSPNQVFDLAVRLSRNKSKLKELGVRASDHVQRYSWENIVSGFEQMLRTISSKQ
jgi:glycosyltransferase involved in cell wall biosynthesis